jgi:hypothetical protein
VAHHDARREILEIIVVAGQRRELHDIRLTPLSSCPALCRASNLDFQRCEGVMAGTSPAMTRKGVSFVRPSQQVVGDDA